MRKLRSASLTLGVVLWVALPVAGLAMYSHLDTTATFVEPAPVYAPVEQSNAPLTTSVDLGLVWRAPPSLIAPSWTGVLQQVLVTKGDSIGNGDAVVVIDGIRRVAWASPGAFFRPLLDGSKGEDVRWLKTLLVSTGVEQSSSDSFDRAALAGTRALAVKLGVPDARKVTSFDPSWVIFLGAPRITASKIHVVAGQPAPTSGEAFIEAEPELVDVGLAAEGALDGLKQTADGGAAVEAEAVESALSRAAVAAPDDAALVYLGAPLGLDESRTGLTDEGIATLGAAVQPGQVGVLAQLTSLPKPGDFRVPAAAIRTGRDGQMCVLLAPGSSDDAARMITVVGVTDGVTIVRGDLRAGDMVRVPAGSDSSCP